MKCIPPGYDGPLRPPPHRNDPPMPRRPKEKNPSDAGDAPPPRYDLLALDLDGTLLRADKQIAKYDAVAIGEAKRRGVKVVIATARPPRSARSIHARLKLNTPLINYNGALIHHVEQARHMFHEPLAADTARAIIDMARSLEPKVIVSIEVLDKWYTDHDDPNLTTETAKKFKPDVIGPLDVPLRDAVTKLMLLASPKRIKRIKPKITEAFAGQAHFVESDDHIMQVVHPEVDKGRALAWVASSLGVAPERVCAIGDAPNDTGMLRWAGLGCAVANSFGSARAEANVLLDHTNDEWAVGRAIERYVLRDHCVEREVKKFESTLSGIGSTDHAIKTS